MPVHWMLAGVRMSHLTVFLARSLGLFTVLLVVAFFARGSAIIDATAADGPVMLAYAIMSLAMGIAIVLGHNVWSGGVARGRYAGRMADLREGPAALVSCARSAVPNVRADAICRSLLSVSRAGARDWALSDLGRIHSA